MRGSGRHVRHHPLKTQVQGVPPITVESDQNLRFEIGHVLFIDIVGYSKLLIDEQNARLRKLTALVLATPQVARSTN